MKSEPAKYRKLKAELESARQEEAELVQRIQEAEDDLNKMKALMLEFKQQGQQAEFEELDNAYQQAFPDYRDLVQQLGNVQGRIQQADALVRDIEDYVRDTGLYPQI